MKRLIAVGVVVLGLVGGCSQEQAATPAGETGATTATTAPSTTEPVPTTEPVTTTDLTPPMSLPSVPTKPIPGNPGGAPGFALVPPAQVDGKALPPDLYTDQRVWVSGDGRTLQVVAVAPDACTKMRARMAGADAGAVKVAIGAAEEPQGGPADGRVCAMVTTPQTVTVALADALGSRRVVLSEGP